MKNFKSTVILAFCLISALTACEVDDQSIMSEEAKKVVNPEPTDRDFVKINSQHKVIMSVIDSGVDYNHPLLKQNIHFDLDENGNPTGLGYDYLGEDMWPAPYIARTLDTNPHAKQGESVSGYDVKTSSAARRNIENIAKANPSLAGMFNSLRSLHQEDVGGISHGTHVAGLMVYDEPRLGLISYKTLFIENFYLNGESAYKPKLSIDEQIFHALQQSVLRKARVINMSLGSLASAPETAAEERDKKHFAKQKKDLKRLEKIVRSSPNTVFVVANGNDSAWLTDKAKLSFPCIKEPNLICVGALNPAGAPADFSNISLDVENFIFAPGGKIYSLIPSQVCDSSKMIDLHKEEYDQQSPKFSEEKYKSLIEECQKSNGLTYMSGTSMASPIVARAVGKIFLENPNLTGAQAVKLLFERSKSVQIGKLRFKRILTEKPSWYPVDVKDEGMVFDKKEILNKDKGYFNFYTPQKLETRNI